MSAGPRLGALALAIRNDANDVAAHADALRIAEAVLFAAAEPMGLAEIAARLPALADAGAVLADLERMYATRGVNLARIGERWAFRTAIDLRYVMARDGAEPQKLSRAALEVLAIVAYHQPVTRAEIEEIRGVSTSKGTLDNLLETRWVRLRGRRKAPGRPVTYGTTTAFLDHFCLSAVTDLPGLEELKGLGLVDARHGSGFEVPTPSDDILLAPDEESLDPEALALGPSLDGE